MVTESDSQITTSSWSNIKLLNIESSALTTFPKGIEKSFPEIEGIQIGPSQIKLIKQSDLKPFRQLKVFCLHTSELETVDEDLFDFNLELLEFHFEGNKIKHVGVGFFNALTKLQTADFNKNLCINMRVDDRSLLPGLINELQARCAMPPQEPEVEILRRELARLQLKIESLEAKIKTVKEML